MHAIERQITHQNWVTLILLLALLLLAILKFYKPNRFFGYLAAFFVQGFIEKRVEENPPFFSVIQGILFLFSTIILSLIILFIGFTNNITLPTYLVIFIVTFFYVFLRNFFDLILEKILFTKEITRYFRFTKLGYLYTTALWMFPFIIVYQFGYQNIYLLVGSLSIITLVRVVIVIMNNKKLIFSNLFYFILYICTLEIAPLLILYKLAIG